MFSFNNFMSSQIRTKDLVQMGQGRFVQIQNLLFDDIFMTGDFDQQLVKDLFLLFLNRAKVSSIPGYKLWFCT